MTDPSPSNVANRRLAHVNRSPRVSRRAVLAAGASVAGITANGVVAARRPSGVLAAMQAPATPGTAPISGGRLLDRFVTVGRAPEFADVPYVDDGDPRHLLDIYLPHATLAAAAPIPVIVWIHGGAYEIGRKEAVGIPYLLEDGYAIVSITYRLMPEHPFPAQIVDANAAISWVWRHADDYRFDRERLVVAGASAGGASSVLVAMSLNNHVPAFAPDPDVRIAAMIDFFGHTTEEIVDQKGPRRAAPYDELDNATFALIDAIQFVDAADPPGLVVHGGGDELVPIEHSDDLVYAMEAAGVPVSYVVYPDLGHGMHQFQFPEMQETVRTFLRSTLG